MTYFAQFDSTAIQPTPVTGWFDTEAYSYPALPASDNLLTLTDAQWAAHFANPAGWVISGGALVPAVPPAPSAPTLVQQAMALLMGGLTITSAGTPALSATYPADPKTQQKLSAVQQVLSVTAAFPGGVALWDVKDSAGLWHTVTGAQFTAIATAIANFVAPIDQIMDGHPGTALPSASATIA